jgi:anti-sigma regulatory factor (Ser/Thr protein kinase)
MADFHAELTLPNDPAGVRLARAFVRELAALADFADQEAEALAGGAEAACANLVAVAFDPGDAATYTLLGDVTPAALTLAIREQGIPFDPAQGPPEELMPPGARLRLQGPGAQWYLSHGIVDEAHWTNLGRQGMELRITKARPQRDVTEHLPDAALTPFQPDAALAPEQTYAIRLLRPEEAIQVAQCIYRAWGYSYPNDDLYYPDRIAHLNATGELVSIVAVDEAGEVVGHYALERPDLGPIAETGQAVVSPAHRGRKLLERMRTFLEEEAGRLGLVGVYGQPVTSHTFSQRVEEDYQAHVCGVSLGHSPRSVTFKGIRSEPLAQRESLLLYFKYLGAAPPAVVHAPQRHRALLERLYGNLRAPAEFREESGPPPPPNLGGSPASPPQAPNAGGSPVAGTTGSPPGLGGAARRELGGGGAVSTALAGGGASGEVVVSMLHGWGAGVIRVRRVGSDTAAEVRRARQDLCETAAAEVVYLELPLAQRGTPALCEAAEGDGFFFSGLGPRFAPDGDALRLQYLNCDLDVSRLQVFSPFGRELLDYVAAERARVGQR